MAISLLTCHRPEQLAMLYADRSLIPMACEEVVRFQTTPQCLFRNYSPLRYEEPFYCGHFRNHVAIFMFDRTDGIRFTHSPSGGGTNAERQTTNPAWDTEDSFEDVITTKPK